MHSHLFRICDCEVLHRFYQGMRLRWEYLFSSLVMSILALRFQSCSLWERIYIAWNQWCYRHVLGSMSFCWWTQWSQRKRVIFSTLPATPAIFFQTDTDYMCLHSYGPWYTPGTTELLCLCRVNLKACAAKPVFKMCLTSSACKISCMVDPICYKPLRPCLHTIAQVSTR